LCRAHPDITSCRSSGGVVARSSSWKRDRTRGVAEECWCRPRSWGTMEGLR
jgi:hypothetical protein